MNKDLKFMANMIILEDHNIDELRTHGFNNRLPVNTRNICTNFYFGAKVAPTSNRAFYVTKAGDTMHKVMKQLGLKGELQKTYQKYLSSEFMMQAIHPDAQDFKYKQHKVKLKKGVSFPRPNDSRWRDMVRSFQRRQENLHPDGKQLDSLKTHTTWNWKN